MKLVSYEELNVLNSKNFEDFYNNISEHDFSQMNELRAKAKGLANYKVYFCCFLVLSVISTLLFASFGNASGIVLILFLLAIVSLIFFTYNSKTLKSIENEYRDKYKIYVISDFVKTFNNDISYMPYVENKELKDKLVKLYKDSGINKTRGEMTTIIDDYMTYENNDYSMQIFDIDFKPDMGENGIVYKTAKSNYAGLFADVSIDLITDYETIIETSKTETTELETNFEKLEMDDSSFESIFNVFTKDAELTKKILTPDVMHELKYFCFNTRLGMTIAIRRNKIYFTFYTGNMFEPKLDGDILNKNVISHYYNILNLIFKLTNYLHDIVNNTYKTEE